MVALDRLLAGIARCRICVEAPRGRPLPHEPRPVLRCSSSARIAIAGQAPGVRVHASGVPFTDPSGDRLRAWMGVSHDEFYDRTHIAIVPMGFCFPGLDAKGGDLPPRKECAEAWREAVFAQLPDLELVLLVGQYAQRWHLTHRAGGAAPGKTLTDTVGRWQKFLDTEALPRYLPLPHPSWRNNSWLKSNAWFEAELVPRLQAEIRRLLGG
ncbi:MAG TPA: uracil-DNA glycosylase family protein [Hyphomicrobiaceae bacterium]|nr:uracil-DNA glycosylase family protein [Hyphomicrobiaceae bacterium]